ncbi:MAG TPA: BON domain-containing protein [Armatimonadota bacterium]|nr:BON domain-containing protein [Armatimonadota bacterium]
MIEGEYDSNIMGPVQATAYRSSDQIEKDVRELISLNDAIQPKDIDVTVEVGKVTLKGKVRDGVARDEAVQAASEVIGVTEVINSIEIGE